MTASLSIIVPVNREQQCTFEESQLDWLERFQQARLRQPFCPLTLAFLQQLSANLLNQENQTKQPELVALGFWLRTANLARMQQTLQAIHKPLGSVMHFTPANVDTMFAYSWVVSLLMGNRNIVRVSSRDSELVNGLLHHIDAVLSEAQFQELAEANLFVKYDKTSGWSQALCQRADGRLMWGGDESVQAIRAYPTSPRCRDVSFADRYSCTLINGDVVTQPSTESVAAQLWKDTEPYLQQACSSPRVVFWLGSTEWQHSVFEKLNEKAAVGQARQQSNQHLVTAQLLQAQQLAERPMVLQAICALPITGALDLALQQHSGSGLFYVVPVLSLEHLASHLDSRCQTLTHWGIEQAELLKLWRNPSISGIERCVPLGQALDFDAVWDGYDLLSQLSRVLFVK